MELDRLEDLEEYGDDAWSVSRLQTIHACGNRYKLRYVDRIREPKTLALKFGSAIHECIELMHSRNIWDEGKVQRIWIDRWTPISISVDWEKEQAGKTAYKNRGWKMLEQYMDRHKDDEVVASEIRFKIPKQPGLPAFIGVIDKVQKIGSRLAVVDFKTSKSPPDPLTLRRDFQLTMYYIAAKHLGFDVNAFAIHHLLTGEVYWTPRTDEDIQMMLESIRDAEVKIKSRLFARNVDYHCKWCPFIEACLG